MNPYSPNRNNAVASMLFGILALLNAFMGDLPAVVVLAAGGVFLGLAARRYAQPGEAGGMPVAGITCSVAGVLLAVMIFALISVGGYAAGTGL